MRKYFISFLPSFLNLLTEIKRKKLSHDFRNFLLSGAFEQCVKASKCELWKCCKLRKVFIFDHLQIISLNCQQPAGLRFKNGLNLYKPADFRIKYLNRQVFLFQIWSFIIWTSPGKVKSHQIKFHISMLYVYTFYQTLAAARIHLQAQSHFVIAEL